MRLLPAETSSFPSPIPTQFVASDEFTPVPQTAKQKQVEARIKELGTRLAKHQGLSRRKFFQTAAGMAAAFVAMNDVYGPIFGVSRAEAQSPDMANERAKALAGQFIMDMQRKHGFQALGPADGPVKRAIFGENSARLYKYDVKRRAELTTDRIALARADYEREGPGRTNRRYGFVAKPLA
ncbi:MAG TPA: hypothetical protein VGQ77_05750 [Methylomirabilota bacterium]|nr:hypothetical protein [Methylomirabilota bacterium]